MYVRDAWEILDMPLKGWELDLIERVPDIRGSLYTTYRVRIIRTKGGFTASGTDADPEIALNTAISVAQNWEMNNAKAQLQDH